MFYDGECATLKFTSLSLADSGTYMCTFTNPLGRLETQVVFRRKERIFVCERNILF
jgi:hypothetical protein